ncbi:MAG: hypothetical protein GY913_16985 [Proteobacteria bacterium]|nr:hypothetical protein [Pseudomonadota bacterium]MCP4918600.1 hypothetical protein [Pseudomonadota bacterium]
MWLLLACGDGVAPTDFPGDALYRVEGSVDVPQDHLLRDTVYGVTIGWAGGGAVDTPGSFIDTSFPAFYTLDLYYPPPAGTPAIVEIDDVLIQGAIVFLYADEDEDGAWDADTEPFVGASSPFMLTYQAGYWTVGAAPSGDLVDAEPGYFAVRGEPGGCVEEAAPASHDDFNIAIEDKSLPDMNCDGRESEWDGLIE